MIFRTGLIVSSVLGLVTICVGLPMLFMRFRFLGLEYLMYPGGITSWIIWGDGTHPPWVGWVAVAISIGFNLTVGFVVGILIGVSRKVVLAINQR